MDLFTAKKLTTLRKYYSLSQEALAEKAGISRQAVSKWERGEASPDTDNLFTLSKIYSVSIDDLLGDMTAEEIIASIEKQKEEEKTAENPATVDIKGTATEVVNEIPVAATKNHKENPINTDSEKQDIPHSSAPENKPLNESAASASEPEIPSRKNKKRRKEKPQPLYPGTAKNMLKFPYIIAAAIVYIIIGYTAKIWHPTWLIFLTVPAYYLTVPAFFAPTKKKILMRLPAYYYIIMLYIFLGILFGLWAKTWILFLFIPVYYWVVSMLKIK